MRKHEPTSLIRHLEVLRAVTEAVSRSLDLNEVVQRSLSALTHVTGHEIASLHLISVDGNTMLLRGDRGLSDELRRVNLRYRCSICGAEVRMVQASEDLPEPPRHCQEDMDLVAARETLDEPDQRRDDVAVGRVEAAGRHQSDSHR